MLKKILGTIGTRYLVALLNLALLFVNARLLGAEGVGLVGLILASIALAVMFNSIYCGSTIVYFMNRYSMRRLLLPSYVWAFAGSGVAAGVLWLAGMYPSGYGWDVYFLTLLNSLVAANSRFLLGKDRILGFNLVFVLQGGLLFFYLLFSYYVLRRWAVSDYLSGLYVANGTALLVSLLFLRKPFLEESPQASCPYPVLLKEMFFYGLWSNVDNLAETFSTRLNYFLVNRFVGLGGVGLLDGGTKISESVWHISRAVGYIAYGEISRSQETRSQRRLTLRLLRLTFLATSSVMLLILFIPEWFYTRYLFSPEFAGIARVIRCLSVGIVALACNTILSQYFIGSGHVRYSAYASCLGLLVLFVSGWLLVPLWGVAGGALATSVAYASTLAYSLWRFFRPNR